MPELSRPYEELAKLCPTCGKVLPCPMHDAALREAMLRRPERSPWELAERQEIGECGMHVLCVVARGDGTYFLGDTNGRVHAFDPTLAAGADGRLAYLADIGTNVWSMEKLHDGGLRIVGGNGLLYTLERGADGWSSRKREHRVGFTVIAVFERGDGKAVLVEHQRIAMIDPDDEAHEQDEVLMHLDDAPCTAAALRSDGVLVFADRTGRVRTFDTSSPARGTQVLVDLDVRAGDVSVIGVLSTDAYAFGMTDGTVRILDATRQAGDAARLVEPRTTGMFCIRAIIPESDRAFVAATEDGKFVRFAIPEAVLAVQRERKLGGPDVPPMPEA